MVNTKLTGKAGKDHGGRGKGKEREGEEGVGKEGQGNGGKGSKAVTAVVSLRATATAIERVIDNKIIHECSPSAAAAAAI